MKTIRQYCFLLLLLPFLALVSCGDNKEDENPRQLIAGESSKSWQAKRESDAQGDKQKLSNTEQEQRMEFYSNGTFQIRDDSEFQSGRWNYNATQKELELVFDDRQDVKEIFHVQELTENKMTLHASDGSTLQLMTD